MLNLYNPAITLILMSIRLYLLFIVELSIRQITLFSIFVHPYNAYLATRGIFRPNPKAFDETLRIGGV